LNAMFDRLEAAFERVSRFTADASHELRTPLSVIRTASELALSRPRTSSEYTEALAHIQNAASHMSRLVEDLLTLARADRHVDPLRRDIVDARAMLVDLSGRAAAQARDHGVVFSLVLGDDPVVVEADEDALRRLVTILTDNAMKYTPAGGRVEWALHSASTAVTLSVKDTGIGIGPMDIPHVFERFYRGEHARRVDQGGVGLGLSIAQWIAEQHGGKIAVRSGPGPGCSFDVSLPRCTTVARRPAVIPTHRPATA